MWIDCCRIVVLTGMRWILGRPIDRSLFPPPLINGLSRTIVRSLIKEQGTQVTVKKIFAMLYHLKSFHEKIKPSKCDFTVVQCLTAAKANPPKSSSAGFQITNYLRSLAPVPNFPLQISGRRDQEARPGRQVSLSLSAELPKERAADGPTADRKWGAHLVC